MQDSLLFGQCSIPYSGSQIVCELIFLWGAVIAQWTCVGQQPYQILLQAKIWLWTYGASSSLGFSADITSLYEPQKALLYSWSPPGVMMIQQPTNPAHQIKWHQMLIVVTTGTVLPQLPFITQGKDEATQTSNGALSSYNRMCTWERRRK